MNPLPIAAWLWARCSWTLPVLTLALGIAIGYLAHRQPAPPSEHEKTSDHETANASAKVDSTTQQGPRDLDWTFYGPGAGAETPILSSLPAGAPRAPARPGGSHQAIAPGAPNAPPSLGGCAVFATLHEHDGPTVIATHSTVKEAATEDHHLDLTLTPSEQSREISLGLKVHPSVQLVIGGGFRLPDLPIVGALWAKGQVAPDTSHPLQSEVSLSLAKQF